MYFAKGPAAAGGRQCEGGDPRPASPVPQDPGLPDRLPAAPPPAAGSGSGSEEGGGCGGGARGRVELVPRPGGFHSCSPALDLAARWGGVRGPSLRAPPVPPPQVGPSVLSLFFSLKHIPI